MPISVNHEERRQRIAAITADLIADRGLDAVTIRQVATAAGYSTTIVTHYFANKQDLLMYAWRFATDQHRRKILNLLSNNNADIDACIEALLPIGRSGMTSWKLYFAYWHVASVDVVFARELKLGIKVSRRLIQTVLDNRVNAHLLDDVIDTADMAKRLLTIIQGVAIQTIVNPAEWRSTSQKKFVLRELHQLLSRHEPSSAYELVRQ